MVWKRERERVHEYARNLQTSLIESLHDADVQIEVTNKGGGIQVSSRAGSTERSCTTHCFHVGSLAPGLLCPEFLTYFCEQANRVAVGRSQSESAMSSSVERWLRNASLEALYSEFQFVDEKKRRLSSIQDFVLHASPELEPGSKIVMFHSRMPEFLNLHFQGETRSAVVYVAETRTHARFLWDETELFRTEVQDLPVFVSLLKRWICDNAMPSPLRVEFPWLAIGKLADFYEAGNSIEGEFLESWDRIQSFFDDHCFPPRAPALQLISELRARGFERTLRAGQSIRTLILSRSRRHGLRQGQPCIRINFELSGDTMRVETIFTEEKRIQSLPVAFSQTFDEAITRLSSFEID